MSKLVILYDSIIFSLQKAGGISSYWYNLCLRLTNTNHSTFFIENKYNGNIEHEKLLNFDRKIFKTSFSIPLFKRFIDIKALELNNKFIFHSSYYRISNNKFAVNVVTIHDFIHEKYYSGLRKWLHVLQKSNAINKADVIITVSNNTRNDLLELYPNIKPENVKVVYNGVSLDYFPLKLNKSCNSKSILYVGSREKYKNFDNLIKILKEIGSYRLVIVGSPLTNREKSILNNMLFDRWENFTYLSNSELNILYNNVYALAYVSSYEGFGIPLLESMKAGCPFIAIRNSAIPEIAANAGILIDSLTTNNFKYALSQIKLRRDEIIQNGFIRSNQFSWNKCFEETINIYNDFICK